MLLSLRHSLFSCCIQKDGRTTYRLPSQQNIAGSHQLCVGPYLAMLLHMLSGADRLARDECTMPSRYSNAAALECGSCSSCNLACLLAWTCCHQLLSLLFWRLRAVVFQQQDLVTALVHNKHLQSVHAHLSRSVAADWSQ